MSPSKKSSNVASTSGGDGVNLVENDKFDQIIVEKEKFGPNFVDKTEVEENEVDEEAARPKRVPRRVLHFSDGILEEYRSVCLLVCLSFLSFALFFLFFLFILFHSLSFVLLY